MKLNLVDYRVNEDLQGLTYIVTLWFIMDPADSINDLSIQELRKYRVDSVSNHQIENSLSKVSGTIVLPYGNSTFPGNIGGYGLDAANADSVLTDLAYGEYATDEVTGRCYREVTLTYTPALIGIVTRPPNNSTGDDPDAWYPEYDRSSIRIERERPMTFLGYLDPDKLLNKYGPITPADGDLLSAGQDRLGALLTPAYEKGDVILPVNSAGQKFPNLVTVSLIGFMDSYTEYMTQFYDLAVSPPLEERQDVVNGVDLIVKVAVGGKTTPYPVQVRYPRGTAKIESRNVSSRVYRYVNQTTGLWVDIPYFIKRTQIAISGAGWSYAMSNMGYMAWDDATDKFKNLKSEDGPIRSMFALDRYGRAQTMDRPPNPGAMVYGLKESTFSGLIGTYSAGTITVA